MSRPERADVLVVGAGHAGVQLAVSVAKAEPDRSVTLLGDEPGLPYERPPLSKRLLYSAEHPEPILLRSADYWARSPITLRTGERVTGVDPAGRVVRTALGAEIGYGSLVWATGGRAAPSGLLGEHLPGVHSLRDFSDLTALHAQLTRTARAVVIGGGYIGLEAAAGLRRRGIAVTVVEIAPRLLSRATGSIVSDFLTTMHRGEGVDIRLGLGVERIVERDGRAAGVLITGGSVIAADLVIVGVGMRPHVSALLEAGAAGDATGILVDDACRTSLADVHAIGDCAKQVNAWSTLGAPVRVESVHNAGQQAAAVARALAGLPVTDPSPPRFWSTQFDRDLKTVGFPSPTDLQVVRGDVRGASFSVVYLRADRMVAIDTVDRPRDFARAQALIAAHWEPGGHACLSDPAADLPRLEPARAGS